MIMTLIVALVIFFGAQLLGPRVLRSAGANIFGLAAVILFFIGFFANAVVFGRSGNGPAVAPPPLAAPAATNSGQVTRLHISVDQLAGLVQGNGQAPSGSLDVLSTVPAAMSNTTGNVFRAGSPIYLRGWIMDAATKSPVPGVIVILDYKRLIDATDHYGGDRPDVAKALGSPSAEFTGFSAVEIPTAGLQRGSHVLQLAETTGDGRYELSGAPIMKFVLN